MAPHVNHNQSTHMILDIHTHHPAPQPDGVINVSPGDALLEGQLYSAGIHPWTTLAAPSPELLGELERICSLPAVVAVGECGVDIARGGPLFRQLQVLKAHIELSERLGKPLILHEVKAHDIILGLRRDMQPSQPWVVHGFRGKPQVAEMLLHGGLWLSFGARFNPESLAKALEAERALAETDDSPQSIDEVVALLSQSVGRDLRADLAASAARFLSLPASE